MRKSRRIFLSVPESQFTLSSYLAKYILLNAQWCYLGDIPYLFRVDNSHFYSLPCSATNRVSTWLSLWGSIPLYTLISEKKKRYLSLLSLSSIMGQSRFAVLARSHERVLLCIFYCGGKERYWYILSHGTSPSSQTHKYT